MSGFPFCWLIGHKWHTVGYREVDVGEGDEPVMLATFAKQICYRCSWNSVTRREAGVHLGPMTQFERSYHEGD
jgi:hypothetical protein